MYLQGSSRIDIEIKNKDSSCTISTWSGPVYLSMTQYDTMPIMTFSWDRFKFCRRVLDELGQVPSRVDHTVALFHGEGAETVKLEQQGERCLVVVVVLETYAESRWSRQPNKKSCWKHHYTIPIHSLEAFTSLWFIHFPFSPVWHAALPGCSGYPNTDASSVMIRRSSQAANQRSKKLTARGVLRSKMKPVAILGFHVAPYNHVEIYCFNMRCRQNSIAAKWNIFLSFGLKVPFGFPCFAHVCLESWFGLVFFSTAYVTLVVALLFGGLVLLLAFL